MTYRNRQHHQKPSSQTKILNKIMRSPKILLVFPFYVQDDTFNVSRWLFPISIIISCLSFITATYYCLSSAGSKPTLGTSNTTTIVGDMADALHSLYNLVSLLSYALVRDHFDSAIRKLTEARILIAKMGYARKIVVSYVIWWIGFFLFIVVVYISVNQNYYPFVVNFNKRYTFIVGTSLVFMHSSFLSILGDQMAFVNGNVGLLQQHQSKDTSQQLAVFSDFHHLICSAAEAIETTHGYPLVLLFLSYFMKILDLSRSLISNALVFRDLSTVMILSFLLLSHITQLCFLVMKSAYTSKKVSNIPTLNQVQVNRFDAFKLNIQFFPIPFPIHLFLHVHFE